MLVLVGWYIAGWCVAGRHGVLVLAAGLGRRSTVRYVMNVLVRHRYCIVARAAVLERLPAGDNEGEQRGQGRSSSPVPG